MRDKWTTRAGGQQAVAIPAPANVPKTGGVPQPAAGEIAGGDDDATAKVARPKRRIRLKLKFLNGKKVSLAYAYLKSISQDGGDIVLEYTDKKYRLKGRNFDRLFDRLDLEIQGSIQQVDEYADKAMTDDKATAVYSITEEDD